MVPWVHRRLSERRQVRRGGLLLRHELLMRPPYTVAIPGVLAQADVSGFMARAVPPYVHLLQELHGVVVGEMPLRMELFNPGPFPVLIGNIWADVVDRRTPNFPTTVFNRPAGASEIDAVVLDLDEDEPSGYLGRWSNGRVGATPQLWWESKELVVAPGATAPLMVICRVSRDLVSLRIVVNYSVQHFKHQVRLPNQGSTLEITGQPRGARALEFTNLLIHNGTAGVLMTLPGFEPID